jgi:hypothetical protein
VPTRCRRGTNVAHDVPTQYGGVLTGSPRDTRGHRGGTEGVLGHRRGSQLCVRAPAMRMCVCACAHLCVCVHLRACVLRACARVRACMRACVSACACGRACMRAGVSACACSCVSIGLRLRARVCSERVCEPRRCARPIFARRRPAVSMARPAPRVAAARAWLRLVRSAGLARRPQVSPGRAAHSTRRGLRGIITRL